MSGRDWSVAQTTLGIAIGALLMALVWDHNSLLALGLFSLITVFVFFGIDAYRDAKKLQDKNNAMWLLFLNIWEHFGSKQRAHLLRILRRSVPHEDYMTFLTGKIPSAKEKEEGEEAAEDVLPKEKTMHDNSGLFAAMVIDEKEMLGPFRKVHVYLVNDTDISYPHVKLLSWGSCTGDDGVFETSKALSGPYKLEARSALKLPGSDTGELDFIIWHLLDMADENNGSYQYIFALPKYGRGPKPAPLPYLDPSKKSIKLPLHNRVGYSIDQHIAIKGIEDKYIEFTKEQLDQIYGRSQKQDAR